MANLGELGYFLGVYLLIIAIGAAIGKAAKGRPGAGALFSALVGPFGWLIALVIKDLRPRCPDCKFVTPAGARKCGRCGASLALA